MYKCIVCNIIHRSATFHSLYHQHSPGLLSLRGVRVVPSAGTVALPLALSTNPSGSLSGVLLLCLYRAVVDIFAGLVVSTIVDITL